MNIFITSSSLDSGGGGGGGVVILAKWSLWPIYEKQSVIGITIVPT